MKITHRELNRVLKKNYEERIPLIVFGGYGIGKSETIIETSKEISKGQKRKFFEWDKTTDKEKEGLFKNPEKYFVVLDFRSSGMDATDLKGIPNFREDKKTIEWKIPHFLEFMTLEKSSGIAFFDEINLGVPIVLNSLYKLVYDRCVDGCKISDRWGMVLAGNRDNDGAYVHTMPMPLMDRCSVVELISPDTDEWIKDFALPNKLDPRIIGYLSFKKRDLVKTDVQNSNQKATTPRGWFRVSKLIKDIPLKDIDLFIKSAIGEGVGASFVAFCKIQEKQDIESIIKNPKKVEDIKEVDTLYFLITALCERYSQKKINFDKIVEFTDVFDKKGNQEYVYLLWKMASSFNREQFKKDWETLDMNIREKYGRLILGD